VGFKGSELVAKVKQKLDSKCSNNQAEQVAILKVLEIIELMNSHSINPRTVTVFTDSRVSLDSLYNPNNHAHLVEEIRKKVISMVRDKWKISFHGLIGNEMADRLAKEAARSEETSYGFSRIHVIDVTRDAGEMQNSNGKNNWKNN